MCIGRHAKGIHNTLISLPPSRRLPWLENRWVYISPFMNIKFIFSFFFFSDVSMLCVWILLFFEKIFIRLIDFWLFLFYLGVGGRWWWCWDTYFEGSCVVFIFFVKVIPRHSTRTHDNDDSLRYLLIVAWAPSEATAPFHALVCRSETTTFAAESNQTISNPSRENQVKIIKTFSLFSLNFFPSQKIKWWEMIRKEKEKHVEKDDDFAVAFVVVILVYLYTFPFCVCIA
jgi:hypothetical protein